jgi:predicted transcriptional regulator
MAARKKTLYFQLDPAERGFISRIFNEEINNQKEDLELLRKTLTKEKSRILYTLKTAKIESIYQLSKKLKRDLKSLRRDLKLLERMEFIKFVKTKKGNKISQKPVLTTDKIILEISL